MRSFIFVRAERTDIDQYAEKVENVRQAFDRYLDNYPRKTARTKTGLMGPVGKILSEAKSGKWDAESLTGYALNIHLMTPNAKGFISEEGRKALNEGIRELITLLSEVESPAVQDKLLDRIDYGLYATRRFKGMEYIEEIKRRYAKFLEERYGSVDDLNDKWGLGKRERLEEFSQARYPSRSRYEKANDEEKAAIDAFWRSQDVEPEEADPEEGEEL
jgi:hypothetical protein